MAQCNTAILFTQLTEGLLRIVLVLIEFNFSLLCLLRIQEERQATNKTFNNLLSTSYLQQER